MRWLFRIGFRLLLFNLLLIALPVGGVFYLRTYEQQLLSFQERAMVQQGRILAAALGSGAPGTELSAEARRILTNFDQRSESRIRVISAAGELLADSAVLGSSRIASPAEALPVASSLPGGYGEPAASEESGSSPRDSLVYRIALLPVNAMRNFLGEPEGVAAVADFYYQGDYLSGAEVRQALQGRYGAATRFSPEGQRSVQLYSAIPVVRDGEIPAAVLVSQSTYRILADLYQLRIDVFLILLWSAAAAMAISFLLSATISRPIVNLRKAAAELVDHRGRITGPMRLSGRRDEIGDLSRSFAELTRRIKSYSDLLESFAADVSHELRNPLAGIRASAELLQRDHPRDRRIATILDEGRKIDARIRGISELSRLDGADAAREKSSLDIADMTEAMAKMMSSPDKRIRVIRSGQPAKLNCRADQIERLMENLLANAVDFAGLDEKRLRGGSGEVTVEIDGGKEAIVIDVRDDGPGVRPEDLESVFRRFYSDRPRDLREQSAHSGLGLAISRSIAEQHGGSLTAHAGPGGHFRLVLPR
jgi:two-component system sensor histidine kinase ChvG